MLNLIRKHGKMKLERDNNYYGGLILLLLGITSIFVYLSLDAFEPLAFLITFIVSGWGFVLLWKSDNDYRFGQAERKISELESELSLLRRLL